MLRHELRVFGFDRLRGSCCFGAAEGGRLSAGHWAFTTVDTPLRTSGDTCLFIILILYYINIILIIYYINIYYINGYVFVSVVC